MEIKKPLIRAARTFLQAFLGTLTSGAVLNLDVSSLKFGFVSGVIAVISFIQNSLEDSTSNDIPKG